MLRQETPRCLCGSWSSGNTPTAPVSRCLLGLSSLVSRCYILTLQGGGGSGGGYLTSLDEGRLNDIDADTKFKMILVSLALMTISLYGCVVQT